MVASELHKTGTANEALIVSGLNFGFAADSSTVLRDLSLTVAAGDIVSILGRSGCGKTTLLNLIAGFIRPQSGLIKVGNRQTKKSDIGYIFQSDALLPWRTVADNLALAREIGRAPKEVFEARRTELLNGFHLDDTILKKYPSQLSGGMKQRVSIIQTLLFDPSLLLLDEPFSALDFFTKLSLETEFYNFVKTRKITALLVTHNIEEAIALSDRIILLNQYGAIQCELKIQFDGGDRQPETVRCRPEFSEYYRFILEEFKAVIGL